jgi:hypothetical protein
MIPQMSAARLCPAKTRPRTAKAARQNSHPSLRASSSAIAKTSSRGPTDKAKVVTERSPWRIGAPIDAEEGDSQLVRSGLRPPPCLAPAVMIRSTFAATRSRLTCCIGTAWPAAHAHKVRVSFSRLTNDQRPSLLAHLRYKLVEIIPGRRRPRFASNGSARRQVHPTAPSVIRLRIRAPRTTRCEIALGQIPSSKIDPVKMARVVRSYSSVLGSSQLLRVNSCAAPRFSREK